MWWTAVFEEQWTGTLLPQRSSTRFELEFDGVDGDAAARNPVALIPASRRVDEVPEPWLAYLAAERSVDEYSSAWSEARRREVIAGSLAFHRVKGTRPALERALAPLGYDVTVKEWFEHGTPRPAYTFQLRVSVDDNREWFLGDLVVLSRVANKAKNARSLMEFIAPERRLKQPAVTYVGGYRTTRRKITIVMTPPPPLTIKTAGLAFAGGVVARRRRVVIRQI